MCFKVKTSSVESTPTEVAPTTVNTGDAQTQLDASSKRRKEAQQATGYASNILAGENNNNKSNKKLLTGQ
jgi:hypothetical protein